MELLGINNRVELAAADRIFRERKVRELMLGGVTVEKPETVSVDRRGHDRHRHRDRTVRTDSR